MQQSSDQLYTNGTYLKNNPDWHQEGSKWKADLVFEFINDLYRYELRRLRHALVTGEIPKAGYYDRVVDLRRKYPLVSFKPHLWVDDVS